MYRRKLDAKVHGAKVIRMEDWDGHTPVAPFSMSSRQEVEYHLPRVYKQYYNYYDDRRSYEGSSDYPAAFGILAIEVTAWNPLLGADA